jgi:hypothetical protein
MASLYTSGWRQGSLLAATLPHDSVALGDGDAPVRRQGEHGLWVVATQECDLVTADAGDQDASIELRRSVSGPWLR